MLNVLFYSLIGGKLLYNIVLVSAIQQQESAMVYICPLPLEPPTSLGCLRGLDLSPPRHKANSHWLSILHMVIYMSFNATISNHLTFPFPHCVHKSVLYVCVSILALQIGSSVTSF